MKRRFLILLSALFAIASIGLIIIQIHQTRESAKMSDNLFNISVNNAIDKVFNQLDQMKVEDYVSQKERYLLLRYRRIDEMNEKMQDIIRNNTQLFYNEKRVQFGVSTQDSVFPLPNATSSLPKKTSSASTTPSSTPATVCKALSRLPTPNPPTQPSTAPSTPPNSTSPSSTPSSAKNSLSTVSTSPPPSV